MELKIVISDPETGKAYQQELKDDRAIRLKGKKLGDEISGSVLGLEGYTLEITGGSDRCGFPIKPGVHGTARPKILMTGGIGYHPKRKVRIKKRVRGESIDEGIVQVNTKVIKKGRKGLEELIGASGEEGEAAEAKAEEKPVEEPKEEVKPEEEEPKQEEKPVEEKPAEEPKPEEAKPEEPKAEEKPADEPKAEEPKEEVKPEPEPEKKEEEKLAEEPKPEEKPAEPKPEEAKPEEKPAEEAEKPAEENKA